MKPISKFKIRILYLAFIVVLIFQTIDFREIIKESGVFISLAYEFTLIMLLALFVYLVEHIMRVKFNKEKPEIKKYLINCILTIITCLSVLILSHIISKKIDLFLKENVMVVENIDKPHDKNN
ncbi:hypothetical protein ACTM3P_24700 [Citrobacter freundii]|uniref:hypothetical protein n=1 Tax=Citrobacter freundii TaxID=546 RepID=UPI00107D88DB|nr:hypothetical protein [Salmonella enterica subsp. enterica serovar Infantis]EAB9059917.1 hypothetical protein [Salmonella enterica subsp. enterica serovar Infantis]EBZ2909701.1 hypothetical protein [Salmonella enterica subsp. enterica serovar Infantis]EDL4061207.1 hypothetical protein [Salmonella enterica subsp. enterica serovar Infantis]EDL4490385.1 hypothetical protein [Salmonella enterica subsp. enterica serovar Infantis]